MLPSTPLSEGNSLPPEMVESDMPPRAPSPISMEDTEVLSQRTSPGREGESGADKRAPEVNTSVAKDQREAIPMTANGGEPKQSGL